MSLIRYIKILIDSGDGSGNNGLLTVADLGAFKNGDATNYALNKPATAASQYNAFGPSLAVDGNFGSFTYSYATAQNSGYVNLNGAQWLKIDLGSIMEINYLNFNTFNGSGFGAITAYRVLVSTDDETYETVRHLVGLAATTRTDAINIDIPKKAISDMNVGDKIAFHYTATTNNVGAISQLGTANGPEIPPTSSANPNGTAHFVHSGFDHAGKIKLVPDRNIQHSITWDTLNTAGIASGSGLPITIDGEDGYTLRLMSGGISATDKDNEWDRIIAESTLGGNIAAGANYVWNWSFGYSWCSTTTSTYRCHRGYTAVATYSYSATENNGTGMGFRPVLLAEVSNVFYLILKDNKAYSYVDDSLLEVASDWASLTNAEKQSLFTSKRFPLTATLQELEYFSVLTFSESDNQSEVLIVTTPFGTTLPSSYNPAITATPKPQFIHASGDIDLTGATNIDWIHINNGISDSVTGDSVLKYVFSVDRGVIWKTYNGSEFVNVLDTANTDDGNTIDGRFVPSTTAMTRLVQNGMTKAEFDAAPWNDITLTVNNKLIRFATIFDLASIADSCYNDNLVYQYDGISVWRQAINGTDYTVRFTSPSKMEVKFLTGGYKAKVNY